MAGDSVGDRPSAIEKVLPSPRKILTSSISGFSVPRGFICVIYSRKLDTLKSDAVVACATTALNATAFLPFSIVSEKLDTPLSD